MYGREVRSWHDVSMTSLFATRLLISCMQVNGSGTDDGAAIFTYDDYWLYAIKCTAATGTWADDKLLA